MERTLETLDVRGGGEPNHVSSAPKLRRRVALLRHARCSVGAKPSAGVKKAAGWGAGTAWPGFRGSGGGVNGDVEGSGAFRLRGKHERPPRGRLAAAAAAAEGASTAAAAGPGWAASERSVGPPSVGPPRYFSPGLSDAPKHAPSPKSRAMPRRPRGCSADSGIAGGVFGSLRNAGAS